MSSNISRKGTQRVARALIEAGVLGFTFDEPVTFKSGIRSPIYLDNRKLPFYPAQWRVIIEAMSEMIVALGEEVEVIAGIETAGIPHGAALAYALQKPFVFVRKQAKEHGLKQRVEGGDVNFRKVLLIEDQISTGGSSLSGVGALREAGAMVEHCAAITSYGFKEADAAFDAMGVTLHVLAQFSSVAEYAATAGMVSAEQMNTITDWLRDPHGWPDEDKA